MGDYTLRLTDYTNQVTYVFGESSAFRYAVAGLMIEYPHRVLWAEVPEGPTRVWASDGREHPMTGMTIGCDRRSHIAAVRYYEPEGIAFSHNEHPLRPDVCLPLGCDSLFPSSSHLGFWPIPGLLEEFRATGGDRPRSISWWPASNGRQKERHGELSSAVGITFPGGAYS